MNTLKHHISGPAGVGKGLVHFMYYRDNALWYKTDTEFLFPVPIEDIGTATFYSNDRAILFMRYIRKYLRECDVETGN